MFVLGQDGKYAIPDSIANEVSKTKYKDVRDLTYALTDGLVDDEMKYRAIVKWISENIEYKVTDAKDANEVIKKGKAKCSGYSKLVHEMCFLAGIQSRIVTGDCRDDMEDIGQRLDFTEHAWNAVKINGEWLLSDATWATSSYNKETKESVYKFREEFFLAKPNDFVKLGHYAKDEELMFLDEKYSKSYYRNEPKYTGQYIQEGEAVIKTEKLKGTIGNSYKITVIKSDTLDYKDFKLAYKNDEYWLFTSPLTIKDKGDEVELIFSTKHIKARNLFFGYKSSYYFGVTKK